MKILLLTLFWSASLLGEKTTLKEQTEVLVQKAFGQQGVDLPPVSLLFLEDLFYLLATTTAYQQMRACTKAAAVLQKEIAQAEQMFAASSAYDKPLIQHTLSITTIQQEHFERCARLFKQEMHWYTHVLGWLKNAGDQIYCALISLVTTKHIPTIKRLTHDLVAYTHLEQTEILTNHLRTLSLLVAHNKHEVPLVIRFWDYPRYRHRLLNGVKKFQTGALPQAELFEEADVVGADATNALATAENAVKAEFGAQLTKAATETSELMSEDSIGSLFDNLDTLEDASEAGDSEDISTAMHNLFEEITPESERLGQKLGGPLKATTETAVQDTEDLSDDLSNLFSGKLEEEDRLNAMNDFFDDVVGDLTEFTNLDLKVAEETLAQISRELASVEKSASLFYDGEFSAEKAAEAAEAAIDAERTLLQKVGIRTLRGSTWLSARISPLDVSFEATSYAERLASSLGRKLEAAYNRSSFRNIFKRRFNFSESGRPLTEEDAAQEALRATQPASYQASSFFDRVILGTESTTEELAESEVSTVFAQKLDSLYGPEGRIDFSALPQPLTEEQSAQEALQAEKDLEWQKFCDNYNEAGNKKIPVPITEQVIDALAHPLRTLGRATKWLLRAPLKAGIAAWKFGSKLTIRQVYRYLMQRTWGKMLVSMIDQTEISMGSQIVISWQNATDAKEYLALSQQRTQLTNTLKLFSATLATSQQNTLDKLNAQFTAQQAVISQEFSLKPTQNGYVLSGLLPDLLTQEKSFLTNALISTTCKQIFMGEPLVDDQFFYTGAMITPEQRAKSNQFFQNTWYNTHRAGNWEFCSTSFVPQNSSGPVTSFVQYCALPFTTSDSPQGDPNYALQNMIFTDYIPPAVYNKFGIESHTIVIECTLLSEPLTPFILGIMCNGARWISGVIDFHHQHRLFCVYALPGQPKGTYNVGFAETFYQTATDQTEDQLSDTGVAAGTNAIEPAFQILNPAGLSVITPNTVSPVPNPLTSIPALEVGTPYRFCIQTEPTQVILSIIKRDGTIIFPTASSAASQAPSSAPTTTFAITDLSRLVYLYHNIGFMSAGCSAQFTIIEPADLLYSPQQIQQIQTTLTAGTSS